MARASTMPRSMSAADYRAQVFDGMTEKEWLSQVVQFARHRGWLTYHTFRSDRSAPGFPDLCMVRALQDDHRIVFAELKRQKRADVSRFQREWLGGLELVAQASEHIEVYLWKPSDWPEVKKVLM